MRIFSDKAVAYLRVSTVRQGVSGLGLEAQRAAVAEFLQRSGRQLVGEFVEVESGARDDRPQLSAALSFCRLHGATLVIAKLDRLSRDAHFLIGLQKARTPFIAADMPEANEMVVGIMAVIAQAEREMISSRTKAALAAAKMRGVKLGRPENLSNQETGRCRGRATASDRSRSWAADLAPIIAEARAEGANSLRAVATYLNGREIPASRGGSWTAVQVSRVVAFIQ